VCHCTVLPGIRTALMDSPDHKCPACETPGQSPDVLIPNKYLRAMVTSFINETSYVSTKKPPASAASSAATHPPAATSAARTAVVKTEPLATDSGRRPTGVPSHLMGMQLQTVGMSQVKAEPTSTELMSSRQSQHPGTQLNAMSVPGGGHQPAVRTAAGERGYQPSRSMGRGSAVSHYASPSQIAAHNYVQPSAAAAAPLGGSGSNVVQSQSAPSLLSNKQPE